VTNEVDMAEDGIDYSIKRKEPTARKAALHAQTVMCGYFECSGRVAGDETLESLKPIYAL